MRYDRVPPFRSLLFALACAGPALAQAQDPAPQPEPSVPPAAELAPPAPPSGTAALEEIVVTAQKREESLQDTPISIVAIDERTLQNLGISDIGDLGSSVPNLQLTPHPNSISTPRIFIRGVGNFDDQITQDPSVAVYMDGVYVARNQGMGFEAADIERVEVLRGPQGTLYGRNATGGAINFVSKLPETGSWGFSQRLGVGSRSEFRSRTMLNAPLGDGAALRLSYLDTQRDGYVDNAGTGEDTFGAEDRDALRADLLWNASDRWQLRYVYDRSNIGDSPHYLQYSPAGVPPERPRRSDPSVAGLRANDVVADGHQLAATWWPAEGLTVKSITAVRSLDSFVYQDYMSGRFGPMAALITENDVDQDQFSQEFQLLGDAFDGRFDYILGLYYFSEDGEGLTANVLPATGVTAYSASRIDNEAYAAYVQGTYTPEAFAQRLHLTVGLRWSDDRRQAELANSTLLPSGEVVPGSQGVGDRRFDNVSPSFTVAYDLSEDANVYAKVVDGYKTGGFNVRASTIERFEEGFGEETLRSYEFGFKSQWWHNRLRLNAALFHADYDDIQLTAQSDLADPTKSDILNAGEATIQGIELDVTAQLTAALRLSLSYGYLDAQYDRIVDGLGRNVTDNYAFVNAPEHSYLIDAVYEVATTPLGDLSLNVNYSWQDEKYATASLTAGEYTIDAYGLLNARLMLDGIPAPRGAFKAAIWGRNLGDEAYPIIYAPLFGGYRAWGEPRAWGLEVGYDFY